MLVQFTPFALVVVLFLVSVVDARSAPPRTLKSLSHPSTLALEILPRRQNPSFARSHRRNDIHRRSTYLRHDDTFRLVLAAFDQTFHLHLRPNDDLIHPDARINYYHTADDGNAVLVASEPLLRESVRAYWGEVVDPNHSQARLREYAQGIVPPSSDPAVLGWARIVVHNQGNAHAGVAPVFEGAFTVRGVTHNVVTRENYLRHRHARDPELVAAHQDLDQSLVIWRDSDVMTVTEQQALDQGEFPPSTCGHDSLPHNTLKFPNPHARSRIPTSIDAWPNPRRLFGLLESRDDVMGGGGPGDNFVSHIGQSAGCPKNQKVVYMGVAADCEYTSQYETPGNATTQILTVWNSASALYKSTFNVSLGIIELQIQNRTCPTTRDPAIPWNVKCSTIDLNERLSLFSQWRGNRGNDGAGLWHLMSGCPTGSEVGIAWLSTLCQQTASGRDPSVVSGTAVSTAGRVEWQVVAHEIGHNFGAIHDCSDGCNSTTSCCPLSANSCNAASKFLMSPVADAGEMAFSPCSLGNICSLMQGRTNVSCVVDPDRSRKTIALNMCGNGIVEDGEDCDPGPQGSNACCNTQTCKFKPGAVCDPASSPCCTNRCAFAPPTQVCRPAQDAQCDTPEMCTGNSSACPTDVFSPNGLSCGPNGLTCASGQCTSLDLQCQIAGSSMNLQKTCPGPNQLSCQVSCQDPNNSNQCIVLQTMLVNGSPCGYGGFCEAGTCKPSSNVIEAAKALYTQNLQISIPVTVVVGLLVIAIFVGVVRCCRNSGRESESKAKRTRGRMMDEPGLGKAKHARLPSNGGRAARSSIKQEDGAAPLPLPPPPPPSIAVPAALVPGGRRVAPRRLGPGTNINVGSNGSNRQHARTNRRQFPSSPIRPNHNHAEWVDERIWNGPG